MVIKAPFPWFGGKSRVADLVWDRFGNVPNYVEPFFGGAARTRGASGSGLARTASRWTYFVEIYAELEKW